MKYHAQEDILKTVRVTTESGTYPPLSFLIIDLVGCGNAILTLLRNALDDIHHARLSKAVERSKAIITFATDKFYAYPYKDVPSFWRGLYYDASLVQCIALDRLGRYDSMVEVVDMALIMAGGRDQKPIRQLLKWIEAATTPTKVDVPEKFLIVPPSLKLSHPISRVQAPSQQWFQKHMNDVHSPVIITGALTHWKALQEWSSPNYFVSKTLNGNRIVPIELGESYVSDAWTQKLVSFKTFLCQHVLRDTTPKGYLAQHNLFTQIPDLRADISIPEYCFSLPPENPPDTPLVPYVDTGGSVLENIWMGPAGTKSPLHNDPHENIFAQVIGFKYFRLFAPGMTHKVYPRGVEGGIEMGNTSLVDVDEPDLEAFPLFAGAEFVEGCLGAGDCLYVPRGWWHFVRSESVSIGVSFWW
jgi:hypothetical protein